MTYPPPPLSDVQRDALIDTMRRQLHDAETVIRELREQLVEAHEENAALKRGVYTEQPF